MPLQYQGGQWKLDGEPITQEDLTALRDQMIDQWADELGALAIEALGITGQGSEPAQFVAFPAPGIARFAEQFARRVVDMLTTAYTWARGGAAKATPANWQTVTTLVTQQDQYAQGFVAALQAGTVSEAQAVARARQYAGASVEAFERGKADQVELTLPAYPGQACAGGANCRCAWEIVEYPDRWEAFWRAAGDKRTCAVCRERARTWSPYVQGKTPEATP